MKHLITLFIKLQNKIQFLLYQTNLGTVERLDNNLGHIKGNCVIACRTCNFGKVGNKSVKDDLQEVKTQSKWTFI